MQGGPEGGGSEGLRVLAAAKLCLSARDGSPCLACPACRKVMQGAHPDVTELDMGPGKEITVDRVRELRADAFVRPFESERKVYLIFHAENLNVHAQNALLKLLEEPPPYASFFLQVSNAASLLPTVRSRCVLIKQETDEAQADPEAGERGSALYAAFRQADELALARVLWSWDKLPRKALSAALEAFCTALRRGLDEGLPAGVAARAMEETIRIRAALEKNAAGGICCAALCATLAGIIEKTD